MMPRPQRRTTPQGSARLAPLAAAVLLVSLLSATVSAEVVIENIEYQDGDQRLVGMLAYDDAIDSPRPGVLVLPEWWGLNEYPKHRARQLARLGYVAFAADMYGPEKVTEDSEQAAQWAGELRSDRSALAQRAAAGLEVLRSHERVAAEKIAAIGYCFGGGAAMELAYSGAPISAVVSFHGTPNAPTPELAEQIGAEILICSGAADPMVQDMDQVTAALTDADVDWTLIEYANAKHAFTNPEADAHNMDAIGYNQRADRQSFAHMLLFFSQTIGAAQPASQPNSGGGGESSPSL